MNSFFNMSMIGLPAPYQAPPNFIEILFRYVMDNGYDKLSIVFILHLYLYMSLDHIKRGFQYFNDKIALHGKAKLEQYVGQLFLMVTTLFSFLYDRLVTLPTKMVRNIALSRVFAWPRKFYRWMVGNRAPVQQTNNVAPVVQKNVINKHIQKLDPTNAVDMNALGHYILTNKRTLPLQPMIDRTYSSKKSTVETIDIPEIMDLALQGDIRVQLSHRIALKYEFETDHVNEKIKKYTCDKLNTGAEDKTKKAGGKAAKLKEDLAKLFGDKNVYYDDPPFWYKKGDWSCDPESMCNTNYTIFWRVMYYLGDVNLIRKFIQYLLGEDSFKFDDKVYEKTDDAMDGDFKDVFKDKANLEGYLAEVPDYHLLFLAALEEQGVKATMDELAKKFMARYQGNKGDINSRISINFTSPTVNKYQLAKFGRLWFAKLIHTFYDQTTKKTGEKVNIYKLQIVYDTKISEEPNPKYIEWEKEQAEELKRKQEEQAQQILALQLQQQLEKDKQQIAAQALQLQQQQHLQQQQMLLQQQQQLHNTAGPLPVSSIKSADVPSTATLDASTSSLSTVNTSTGSTTTITATTMTTDVATPIAAVPGVQGGVAPLDTSAAIILPPVPDRDYDNRDSRDRRGGKERRDKGYVGGSHRDTDKYPVGSSYREAENDRHRGNRRRNNYQSDSSSSEEDSDYEAAGMMDLFDNDYDLYGPPSNYVNPNMMHMMGKKNKKNKKWKKRMGAPHFWNEFNQQNHKPTPSKTIKVEHKIPSVQAKLIKQDRKPLEYLYLPEQSMDSLVEYLRNFKDHRDRFQKYGFPYRGGLILSGAPGCGKSSTILATATYLQKDIYYLDLGQIRTNHELKLCVDHIRTNSANGGVIIFEDIDCMNDIVHRRPEGTVDLNKDTNLTKITEEVEGPLSLSYLLSVLDGTMAPEDVIFIMTTNHIEKLDKALIRPGRIDLDIELTKCTRTQLQKIYLDMYGKELPQHLIERFPEKHWITARVILHLFHNSFDSNIDPEVLIAPLLNTEEDELFEMYTS
jgi:hypothetical protein